MSEFYTEVIKVGPVSPLPNSDNLSITDVMGGYPCIFKNGTLKEGDLAVYISVDALVPTDRPEFSFLAKDAKYEGGPARIKAIRLRGTFSMGLLIPAAPEFKLGQNVQKELGIEKYLPPAEREPGQANVKKERRKGTWYSYAWYLITTFFKGKPPKPPSLPYYDIEGIRKYKGLFQDGEEVVLTEKIHGSNAVYVNVGKKFFARSRTVFRYGDDDNYNKIAKKYNLKESLKKYPNYALWGEIYSASIQKGFDYGVPQAEGIRFAAFDVLDTTTNKYLDYDDFLAFCEKIDVPVVPELYRGPWKPELIELAEGKTVMPGADHVREGFVAKPVKERFAEHFGRVILKLHGEGFLTKDDKKKKKK